MTTQITRYSDRFAILPARPDVGDKVEIRFFNPRLAGQEIKIGILNGPDLSHELTMLLDASGKGSVEWRVPVDMRWHWLSFIHETSLVHTTKVRSKGPHYWSYVTCGAS